MRIDSEQSNDLRQLQVTIEDIEQEVGKKDDLIREADATIEEFTDQLRQKTTGWDREKISLNAQVNVITLENKRLSQENSELRNKLFDSVDNEEKLSYSRTQLDDITKQKHSKEKALDKCKVDMQV